MGKYIHRYGVCKYNASTTGRYDGGLTIYLRISQACHIRSMKSFPGSSAEKVP
jgi:hypothetical protein